jgi:hypothetical protein
MKAQLVQRRPEYRDLLNERETGLSAQDLCRKHGALTQLSAPPYPFD